MKNFFQKALKRITTRVKSQTDGKTDRNRIPPKEIGGGGEPKPDSRRPDRKGPPRVKRPVRKKEKAKKKVEEGSAGSSIGTAMEETWDVSQFKVPPREDRTRFQDFNLPDPLLHAIQDLGFEYCTPIQAEILPSCLSGKDASGRAQTGTGKTAAFMITVITRMLNHPCLLYTSPSPRD